jgi:predicted DNA-binding transcriptional regulator AlpA
VGKKIDTDDLTGAHEIARRLGVGRPQVVHEWRQRHANFPKPIATLKTALIWDWREIEVWAQMTGRDLNLPKRESHK